MTDDKTFEDKVRSDFESWWSEFFIGYNDSIVFKEQMKGCYLARAKKDKAEIERLKAIFNMFQVYGTEDCSECEEGRVSLFIANKKCIHCAPSEYDKSFPKTSMNSEIEKIKEELVKAKEEFDLLKEESTSLALNLLNSDSKTFNEVILRREIEKRDKMIAQAEPYVEILFYEAVSKNFFLDLPKYEKWLADYQVMKS